MVTRTAQFRAVALLLLGLTFSSASCARQPAMPQQWTNGFWFWQGGSTSATAGIGPVDVLFYQAGGILPQPEPNGDSPLAVYPMRVEDLPPAREYWMVFRYDGKGIPIEKRASQLAAVVTELEESAMRRGRHITGIQLDVDSPTNSLRDYAQFLRSVRKQLPPRLQLSITALLDWFRPGTDVGAVIQEVDEFVPQFYDTGEYREGRIAARIDGARWNRILSVYKKRFRIGISTFGRARALSFSSSLMPDARPFDISTRPEFQPHATHTDAGEVRLVYRATRHATIGYTDIEPGQGLEFTLPTRDGVRAAVQQARLTGPYCAGVVFFRWAAHHETMALLPDEILEAAGATPHRDPSPQVRAVNGSCAAVACADVYIAGFDRLAPSTSRYRVTSNEPLEYFIPKERTPARMSGPAQVEVTIPAYPGRSRLLLGRVVTRKPAQFSIERAP